MMMYTKKASGMNIGIQALGFFIREFIFTFYQKNELAVWDEVGTLIGI